jgi:CheY-like chemotaxis protein
VESEVGKGSTFCVFLPVLEGAVPMEKEGREELPGGSERILLVDDEPSLVDVGQKLLEHLGYRVFSAYSSPEALEIFKRNPHQFDLVITDFTMPGLTGAKLAEELLRIRPDLPIIMSTGFSDRISPELAREMGIKSFVYKPLSAKEMARVIRQALDR